MALKPFNSVAGFSVGEIPSTNIILANGDITASNATFAGNLLISNANASWGILTDNLYYSNGVSWDLQEAAGSNNQVQFNNNNNFGASANFTFDTATNLLTVAGNIDVANADLGNLVVANYANISNDLNVQANIFANNINAINNVTAAFFLANSTVTTNNLTVNVELSGNTANFSGNISVLNANLGNLAAANYVNISNNLSVTNNANVSNLNATNSVVASTLTSNVTTGTAPLTVSSTTKVANLNADLLDGYDSSMSATANTVAVRNADGNLTANYFIGNGSQLTGIDATSIQNGNSNVKVAANGNVSISVTGTSNVVVVTDTGMNVAGYITSTGNVTAVNADLGNLVTANFIDVSSNIVSNNLTVNSALSGNTANFTGNITAINAGLGNLVTANYVNVANDLNVIGNVNASNLVGTFANGTSNVKIYQDANVEISVAGNANVATVTSTSFLVAGNIQSTSGNILSNGNITANGFLVGGNASVTGEANIGSLKTATITALTGDISISAGANGTIELVPNGTGTVSVNGFRITQLPDPIDPLDATNKEYVDALAGEGLVIHAPVRAETESALNATYTQGGTTPTVTDITNGTDITFSASHGLSVNDGIVFDNSFNGLNAGEAYWVFSVVDSTTIILKDGYFGAQVTGLTNGAGLTQGSRANPGVGATLTNAGANAALQVDGISLSTNDRVLVYEQAISYENGIYEVTTVGDGSTAWVLTRTTDFDKYIPSSPVGIGKGSYVFVSEGLTGAGESYVMTAPSGEVIVGTDSITFTQFSAAGSYSAGNGISITGSIISANTDGVTTDIVGGNIVIKTSANLTTPNIGDAVFSSLTWNTLSNGNISANNLSIGNIANITANLTVGGNVQVNGTISSNANISGLNLTTSGNVEATGNVLANNISANTLITVPTANVSNIVNAGNVTISNELSGNTANFSGSVVVPNLSVNLELAGNTANFSGNVILNNLTTNLELAGNTANFSGNVILNNLTTNLELAGNTANFSGNVVVPNLAVNLTLSGNTANFSGNISALNANLGNLATANFFNGTLINGSSNIVVNNNGNIDLTSGGTTTLIITSTGANINGYANVSGNLTAANLVSNIANVNKVLVGNTQVGWGTVTTTSISANQTIATLSVTGVTGVEFLVKGVDSSGSKYVVATVQAVTDGTSVDYTTFGTVDLGGLAGVFAVNIVGSNVALQVSPSSTNSTVWTTQFRTI